MKRRFFTLLEIMICIVILGMVGGVLAWQAKDLVADFRFRGYARELKDELEKLQILAMTYRSDMKLELRKEEKRWKVISKTEEAALKKEVNCERSLPYLEEITWNGKEEPVLVFDIFSTGRIEKKGVLKLVRGDAGMYVDLSMPLQIKLSKSYPKELKLKIPEEPSEIDKPSLSTRK
jgi:hypothetical protein